MGVGRRVVKMITVATVMTTQTTSLVKKVRKELGGIAIMYLRRSRFKIDRESLHHFRRSFKHKNNELTILHEQFKKKNRKMCQDQLVEKLRTCS